MGTLIDERNNMGINLGHNEVSDVEHCSDAASGDV